MNKQKYLVLFCAILAICGILLAFSLLPQLSGNYSTLDAFREDHEEHYDGGSLLCSIDLDGRICDFVIVENRLHIVVIRCKQYAGTIRYKEGEIHKEPLLGRLQMNMESYQDQGRLPFSELLAEIDYSLHFSKKQLYWCIMENISIALPDGVDSHSFIHDGKSYVLYTKTEER